MARLRFKFPQFPCPSLACPFSKVFVVGEVGPLLSFLHVQVLPHKVSHGVMSSFPRVKGKSPLYLWGCLLRVRMNPIHFGGET
jgi:hypothetical protein